MSTFATTFLVVHYLLTSIFIIHLMLKANYMGDHPTDRAGTLFVGLLWAAVVPMLGSFAIWELLVSTMSEKRKDSGLKKENDALREEIETLKANMRATQEGGVYRDEKTASN